MFAYTPKKAICRTCQRTIKIDNYAFTRHENPQRSDICPGSWKAAPILWRAQL